MRKVIFYALLIIILSCYSQPQAANAMTKAHYEATWMRLSKVGDSYVVYNYPSLWNDEKTKSPYIIKIQGNKFIWITYSDDAGIFSFDRVEKRDDDVYFFQVSNCFSFQWEDKNKHIAKWTNYYGCENRNELIGELYIDSLYNTFPIIDFEWNEWPIDEAED